MVRRVSRDLLESEVLDANVPQLERSDGFLKEGRLLRGRFDHRKVQGGTQNLQWDRGGAASGTKIEPIARGFCDVCGGEDWLDQEPIDSRFVGGIEREGRQVDPCIPAGQQLEVRTKLPDSFRGDGLESEIRKPAKKLAFEDRITATVCRRKPRARPRPPASRQAHEARDRACQV